MANRVEKERALVEELQRQHEQHFRSPFPSRPFPRPPKPPNDDLSTTYAELVKRFTSSQQPPEQVSPISAFSDADMVMDMIRRGYAVMKLPEDGGPPETLRG